MRSSLIIVLGALFTAGISSQTQAALSLRLSDGGTTVTITDGGAGDANAAVGAITFIGAVGTWTTNVTTGLSDPILSGPYPNIDLNSVDVSSAGGGTLTIWLSDTDVGGSPYGAVPGFTTHVGGTTNGSVSIASFATPGQVDFGDNPANLVNSLGPFSPVAFSGSDTDLSAVTQAGNFSVTLRATISHESATSTSFDADLRAVPEPATLAIWALGACGVLLAGRFRRKAA